MTEIKSSNAYAVIMAGGRGERFWPQSRLSHPKQLLRLLGNLTLIEQTVERLAPLFDPSHIIIITNSDYVAPMRSLLPGIPSDNIIGEPVGKDTAPCISLAAAYIQSIARQNDPILCILPSDHIIKDVQAFDTVLEDCIRMTEQSGRIVTVGIKPTVPSTGYGYISVGEKLNYQFHTVFHEACSFKEKPNLKTAEEYLASGNYKWNAGMFIMKKSTLLDAFDAYAPSLLTFYRKLCDIYTGKTTESLEAVYHAVEKISFDYAVMERVKNIAVADSGFDWDDVGSWTSMRNQIRPESNNNVVRGLHLGIDTKDCIIVGNSKHLIATVDVKDLIIVHSDDATLVCDGKSAQRIKELVQLLGSKPELESFQ